MNTAGIIAEYNPFHNGHAYHIATTRAALGPDCAIVCVMSGNFVQRGTAAAFDKWNRAAAALQNGADLLLELSLPFAISSAEHFARGAVQTLNATGIVDILSFGSEGHSSADLWCAAQFLQSEIYREALRVGLDQGLSFASARQAAADMHLGSQASCLTAPNSTLGVEYCKALLETQSSMTPLVIHRRGAAHDAASSMDRVFASASQIRRMLANGDNPQCYLPKNAALGSLHSMQNCERAVLARLRAMSPHAFEALPDCGEGLSNRLYSAVQTSCSIEELLSRCKTKRYAHSRLRRLVLWAFLGLTSADRPNGPQYLRVLGFSTRGRTLLHKMNATAQLPILTKPAHVKRLSSPAQQLFALEARSTDLYALCAAQIEPCGLEWKSKPIVISN